MVYRKFKQFIYFLASVLRTLTHARKLFVICLCSLIVLPIFTKDIYFSVVAEEGCDTYYLQAPNGEKYCVPKNIIGTLYEESFNNAIHSGNISEDDYEMFKEITKNVGEGFLEDFEAFWNYTFNSNMPFKALDGARKCLFTGDWEAWRGCKLYGEFDLDSGNRKYYDNPNSTSGDSANRVLQDTQNKTITTYNTTNNTWVTNNYTNKVYNTYNNTYNYITNNNYQYNINYNYNYTYVTVIDNAGNEGTTRYYWELPDGSSSLNMTEEDAFGYKLDFRVKNYDNITDGSGLVGLFHFNGDIYSSSYVNSSLKWIKNPSTSYFTNDDNFGSYIMTGNASSLRQFELKLPESYDELTLSFRIYTQGMGGIPYVSTTLEKSLTSQIEGHPYDIYFPIFGYFADTGSCGYCSATAKKNLFTAYAYSLGNDNLVELKNKFGYGSVYLPGNKYKIGLYGELIPDPFYIPRFINEKPFNLNDWNTISFTISTIKDEMTLYINGLKMETYQYDRPSTDVLYFTFPEFSQVTYIDELAIFQGIKYTDTYVVPSTQFDTNLIYVLPDTDLNNTILVKSNIPVNKWQIGGHRYSEPTKGDVYMYVDDNGYIQSSQQFNGADWVETDCSVYNQALGRWVDVRNYSVKSDGLDYNPEEPDNPSGSGDLMKFLEGWFDKIIDAIDNITQNVINLPSTSIWDFLNNVWDSIIDGIGSIFGSVSDFVKWLLIPENFDVSLGGSLNFMKENLGILYAPIDIFDTVLTSIFGQSSLLADTEEGSSNGFVLSWSDVTVMDTVLIPSGSFDMNEIISIPQFNAFYQIYLIVVDAIVWFGVIDLARKKLGGLLK